MNDNKFNCPHCGSDNTASVQMIYKTGHATGTATHRGVVGYDNVYKTTTYADGHSEKKLESSTPIYGDITEQTEEITELAKEIAPPVEPQLNITDESSFGCLGCFFTGVLVWGGFNILASIFFAVISNGSIWEVIKLALLVYGPIILLIYIIDKIRSKKKLKKIEEQKSLHAQAMQKWERDMELWRSEWICFKCGQRFRVD